ncbi:hypothetical protein LXL04_007553 [Taraxacum kok-saghyz]
MGSGLRVLIRHGRKDLAKNDQSSPIPKANLDNRTPLTKEEFNQLNNKVDQILGILQQQATLPSVVDREKHLDSLIFSRLEDFLTKVDITYCALEAKCLLKVNECLAEVTTNSKTFRDTIDDLHHRQEKRISKLEDEIKEKNKQLVVINQVLVHTMATISDQSDAFNFTGLQNTFEKSLLVLQQKPTTTNSLLALSLAMQNKFEEILSTLGELKKSTRFAPPESSGTRNCFKTLNQQEAVRATRKIDAEVKRWIKEFETLGLEDKEEECEEKDETHNTEEEQLCITILNNLQDQRKSSMTQGISPRADHTITTVSEVDFPIDERRGYPHHGPPYLVLSAFLKDYLCELKVLKRRKRARKEVVEGCYGGEGAMEGKKVSSRVPFGELVAQR